jgi:cytidine deaminase
VKQIKVDFSYRVYLPGELKESDKKLVKSALDSAKSAYAPYSGFKVGVAARLESGKIVNGNNQENAAFPSGLCAERVALFYIQSHHPGDAVCELAITAISNGKQTPEPVYPCGACRQVMIEHEARYDKPIRLLFCGSKNIIVVNSAADIMPLHFTGKGLKAPKK